MAAVGSINLLFQATTGQAIKGIKGLQSVMSSSMSGIASAASIGRKGINDVGAAAAKVGGVALAAVGGLTAFATHSANNAKETQRWADSLGVPAKRLSALQAVGAKFGVTSERIGDAQKDLNEKIADAASGTETYRESLNAMGLKWQDLQGMRADEQFFKVAEAIQKMGNAGDQSFRAMEMMGDAGFDVLGMIRANGSELKNMTVAVENSSLSLSNLERGSLLALGDSFTNMTTKAQMFGDKLASNLAPTVEQVFNWIGDKITWLSDNWKGMAKTMVTIISQTVTAMANGFDTFFRLLGTDLVSIGKMMDEYLLTPILTWKNILSDVVNSKDISKLVDPKSWFQAQQKAMEGGGPKTFESGMKFVLDDKNIIRAFDELITVTEKGQSFALQLDAKESGGMMNKPKGIDASTQFTAQQINPNQIRLGNVNDSGNTQQKQLIAQQATQQNTTAIYGVLTNIYKRLNMGNVNLGALGAGV
jgi:hypothetical protein